VLLSLETVGNYELIYSRNPMTARQYYQEALDGFLERLKAEPASVRAKMDVALAHYYVATADLRAGNRDSAMAHYRACRDMREALAKDPQAKLSSLDLMLALARTGDHGRASAIAEAMIKVPPRDARIYFHSACGFTLSAGAAASLPPSAESSRRVRHYTDRALDALRLALKRGWRSTDWPARIASALSASGDDVGTPDCRRKAQNSAALIIAFVERVRCFKPPPASR
jgi:tetratricopeptide (TPR) repeat protein